MDIPCDRQITCPGSDSPVRNYTAEGPDTRLFCQMGFYETAPLIGVCWDKTGCATLACSTVSRAEALLDATQAAQECVWSTWSTPSCPPSDDGIPPTDPPPTEPPRTPVSVFRNTAQTCVAYCPDGSPFSYTVAAGQYSGLSQREANTAAYSVACRQAGVHLLCISGPSTAACAGKAFSSTLTASGAFVGIGTTWSISAGTLPTGLALVGSSGGTAVIAGTPIATGTYTFSIRCQLGNGDFMVKATGMVVSSIATTSIGTVTNEPYSEFLIQFGALSPTWAIISGSLPPGITLDSSTGEISGTTTAAEDGDYPFTVGLYDSGVLACSATFTASVVLFPEFVWGFNFSYTFPAGPAMYLPDGSDQTPAGVSMVGNVLSGIPDYFSAPLGSTHIAYQGYAVDGITPVGPLIEHDTSTTFKVYSGEWKGALPAIFTKDDIVNTLTNSGTAGPRIDTLTNSRNVSISFPTYSSTYRVIAIPGSIFNNTYPSPVAIGKDFNRIRFSNNSAPTFINGPEGADPGAEIHAYTGFPYSPDEFDMGDLDNVPYFVFVIDAVAGGFTVYYRNLQTSNQVLQQLSTNNGWVKAGAVNRLDPSVGQMISVRIQTGAQWDGSSWIENTAGVPGTSNREVRTDFTYIVGGTVANNDQTLKVIPAVALAAYDGVPDYAGASANKSVWATAGDSSDFTVTSGYLFDVFTGTGTVPVSITAIKTFTEKSLGSYIHTERNVLGALTDKSSAAITFDFSYYAP